MNNVVKEFLNFYLDNQMSLSEFKNNHSYQKNKCEADRIEDEITSLCSDEPVKQKLIKMLDQYREKLYNMEYIAQCEMFEYAFISGLKLGMDTKKTDAITEKFSSVILEETVENSK